MVIFRFFPQWKYGEVESWLSNMEQSGYRLSNIVCFWFFEFAETNPRNTRYIFLYDLNREIAMYDCEHELKMNGATQIATDDITTTMVYRITNPNYVFDDIIQFRQRYLEHVFVRKMHYSVILMFPTLFGLVLGKDSISTTPVFNLYFLAFLFAVGAFCLIWNLIGLICTKRHNKLKNSEDGKTGLN